MRNEIRFLIAALAFMLVGVGCSLVILRHASHRLAAANEVIVDDAAPSVIAVDDAQARLRRLQTLLVERRVADHAAVATQDASIQAARRNLERAIDEYLALPMDPGEAPIFEAVRKGMAQLSFVVDRVLTTPPGTAESRRDLDEATARLGEDLIWAGELNAQVARDAAATVTEVSRRELPLAAAVEALTFLAAAVTLILTIRAVKRAESLWAQARAALDRRAEELEMFAIRVAHDLLSPLMSLSLAMELAGRRLTEPEDSPARDALDRATRTLERIRRFVSDLLDFARAGARPLPGAHAGVDDAVREVADELTTAAREAGVELSVAPEASGRDAACSAGVLVSVLSNLVQNAIKYIGQSEVRRVLIRTASGEGEIRVEVEDSGPGIPAAERERLFDPYVRGRETKGEGLGLGLATVKRLVESHGGHVGVQSSVGHGSVFWFSLPAAS